MSKNIPKLPQYRCHKLVRAAPIVGIEVVGDEGNEHCEVEVAVDKDILVIHAPPSLISRGMPQNGDYFVVYDDGYVSWSPRGAFEGGYTVELPPMSEPSAAELGAAVREAGLQGP